MTIGLNQDTLGGILKAALSQFLAMEIARMSIDRSESKITKYMPWLFNPPNTITTQGPKEFLECVSHIRLLSWLLLGAMSHTMMVVPKDGAACQPIPLEASCHIADHIEVTNINAYIVKSFLLKLSITNIKAFSLSRDTDSSGTFFLF